MLGALVIETVTFAGRLVVFHAFGEVVVTISGSGTGAADLEALIVAERLPAFDAFDVLLAFDMFDEPEMPAVLFVVLIVGRHAIFVQSKTPFPQVQVLHEFEPTSLPLQPLATFVL